MRATRDRQSRDRQLSAESPLLAAGSRLDQEYLILNPQFSAFKFGQGQGIRRRSLRLVLDRFFQIGMFRGEACDIIVKPQIIAYINGI